MKIKLTCPYCIEEQLPNIGDSVFITFDTLELCNKQYYKYTCPNGHETGIFLSNHRYEILFDMGICAYLDGYYREAVLDFAACLERFYEYCIFMILFKWDKKESLDDMWKEMSSLSERQYGAFVALYYSEIGTPPPRPEHKQVEFRNKVTHKGYFPTKEETYQYAEYVANRVLTIKSELPDELDNYYGGIYQALKEVYAANGSAGGHNIATLLSLHKLGNPLEKSIEVFQRAFNIYYEK